MKTFSPAYRPPVSIFKRVNIRHIAFILAACLPFSACSPPHRECSSEDVLKNLHAKLVTGMNYTIGIEDFYDGKRGKFELSDPRFVGVNGDLTLCSITMKITHYVDPATRKTFATPQERTVPMPYTFKVLDEMLTIVYPAQ